MDRLDNALRNVFIEEYEELYKFARDIFSRFKSATHAQVTIASKEIFLSRVMAAERTQDLPSLKEIESVTEFVLPRIISDSNDLFVMSQITEWLSEKLEM